MTTYGGRLIVGIVPVVFLAMGASGCVSVDRYHALEAETAQVRQQLKEAQVAFAEEKLRVITLEKRNQAMQAETDKYQAHLKATVGKLERLADDWGQVRDDLIRLNMDRELRRMRTQNPDAKGLILLEPEPRPASQEATPQTVPQASPQTAVDTVTITPEMEEDELDRVLEQFRSLLKN